MIGWPLTFDSALIIRDASGPYGQPRYFKGWQYHERPRYAPGVALWTFHIGDARLMSQATADQCLKNILRGLVICSVCGARRLSIEMVQGIINRDRRY